MRIPEMHGVLGKGTPRAQVAPPPPPPLPPPRGGPPFTPSLVGRAHPTPWLSLQRWFPPPFTQQELFPTLLPLPDFKHFPLVTLTLTFIEH